MIIIKHMPLRLSMSLVLNSIIEDQPAKYFICQDAPALHNPALNLSRRDVPPLLFFFIVPLPNFLADLHPNFHTVCANLVLMAEPNPNPCPFNS